MLDELLKLQENGQFPDDPVKMEGTQILCVDTERLVKILSSLLFLLQQNKKW